MRRLGLRVTLHPPRRHGHVGLGFRFVVQRNGKLDADTPFCAERGSERFVDQLDGEEVGIALGLAHDELPRKQLEALARLKHTLIAQAVRFHPRPAAGARICRLHGF